MRQRCLTRAELQELLEDLIAGEPVSEARKLHADICRTCAAVVAELLLSMVRRRESEPPTERGKED